MTAPNNNGAPTGHGVLQRLPPPALSYEGRMMALLALASAVDRDDQLRAVVSALNYDIANVPLDFVFGVLAYAIRCCPQMRTAATRQAIEHERQALRESWALADQLDEWKQEEHDLHTRHHPRTRTD